MNSLWNGCYQSQDGTCYVVEVNGKSRSKIIDITGHNYFQDLVKHVEKKVGISSKKEEDKKEDTDSPRAQLASLEQRADSGGKLTVHEYALIGALRRMVRAA